MSSSIEIEALASKAIFGKPLVTNVYRSVLVEAMVATVLPAGWSWTSADYASCDFTHQDGTRLEVKQSARKQTWSSVQPSPPSWDIKPRTGFWVGGIDWHPHDTPTRNSDIYLFGLHPLTHAGADHRDPSQWCFFVIPTTRLPAIYRLSEAKARSLADEIGIDQIAQTVDRLRLARHTSQDQKPDGHESGAQIA